MADTPTKRTDKRTETHECDYISRQAAIDAMRKLYIANPRINNDYAYNMAIDQSDDAIRNLPSAQPEITEDDVKEWAKKRCLAVIDGMLYVEMQRRWSASAQRKGKWIATQEWGGRNYSCSCCKFSFIVGTCMLEPMWNFCPNCGAEMVKGEEI